MEHQLSVSGRAFKLKPINRSHADFVFRLRRDPAAAQYINVTASDIAVHHSWLNEYFERSNDYYFIVADLSSDSPQGTTSLYNLDPKQGIGEWGRWIIHPDSFGGVESAYLTYKLAFEHFRLERVLCHTITENVRVVSFHDACGLIVNNIEKQALQIGTRTYDVVEHMITPRIWKELEPRLLRRCETVANLLARDNTGGDNNKARNAPQFT